MTESALAWAAILDKELTTHGVVEVPMLLAYMDQTELLYPKWNIAVVGSFEHCPDWVLTRVTLK